MFFRQVFDPDLAQYAYLIGCQKTGEALVIDPERDVDRYFEIAAAEGLRLIAAAETHIHADFVSGARELAERGLRVYLSDAGPPEWQSLWAKTGAAGADRYDIVFVHDGDTIQIGKIELRVCHTPGHTPEHVSYVLTDRGGGADQAMGIASGDFLFVGDLGRPDLLESAAGISGAMRPSAERLYHSVTHALDLPAHLQVWPGHGAGSSCGKALGAVPTSTVGYEKLFNPALAKAREGEQPFIDFILDAQPEPPLYFARMKRVNKEGPAFVGEVKMPPHLGSNEWGAAVSKYGAVILDTRNDRRRFMNGHLPGALFAPVGKDLCVAAGSYVEPGEPMLLVVDSEELDHAVRCLLRIGLDDIAGYITPAEADALTSEPAKTPIADFGTMIEALRGTNPPVVLDVRGAADFEDSHIPGAINVAHTRLRQRFKEIPAGRRIFVHCATGRRSSFASAFLQRMGHEVVFVDGDYDAKAVARVAQAPQSAQTRGVAR